MICYGDSSTRVMGSFKPVFQQLLKFPFMAGSAYDVLPIIPMTIRMKWFTTWSSIYSELFWQLEAGLWVMWVTLPSHEKQGAGELGWLCPTPGMHCSTGCFPRALWLSCMQHIDTMVRESLLDATDLISLLWCESLVLGFGTSPYILENGNQSLLVKVWSLIIMSSKYCL